MKGFKIKFVSVLMVILAIALATVATSCNGVNIDNLPVTWGGDVSADITFNVYVQNSIVFTKNFEWSAVKQRNFAQDMAVNALANVIINQVLTDAEKEQVRAFGANAQIEVLVRGAARGRLAI